MITIVALAAWALNAAVGTFLLVRWLGANRRSVPPLAYAHLGVMVTGLALWAVRVAGEPSAVLAWSAFAVLTLGNALGDLLMLRSRRGRLGDRAGSGPGGYRAAVMEIVRGRRPVVSLHAFLAPVAYFLVLAAAIASSG